MADLTPKMRQYQELKARHPGALLLFRLGDFFELFGEDAETASRDLDLVLTSRDGEVPMCGIPHHALDGYLGRLMEKGYRVALAEQMEDPRTAKGLVKREVVRLVTPSTWVEGRSGEEGQSLVAIVRVGDECALARAVPATGRFEVRTFGGKTSLPAALQAAERIAPAEWLAGDGVEGVTVGGTAASEWRDGAIGAEAEMRLRSLLSDLHGPALKAARMVGAYLASSHPGALENLEAPSREEGVARLEIDAHTWRHLEVDRRLDGGRGPGTLLHVLDATLTPIGKRTLQHWLQEPFGEIGPIMERQEKVAAFFTEGLTRSRIAKPLSRVRDVERILARLAIGAAGPRELLLIAESLEAAAQVVEDLGRSEAGVLRDLAQGEWGPATLARTLREALAPDPPANWRERGHFIREGYESRLDALRNTKDDAQAFLAELEEQTKRETGIRNLKVGFNRVFGYYLEVPKGQISLVPHNWERRQTLTGAERFVTPALKEQERVVLESDEAALALETEIFETLSRRVLESRDALRSAARRLGEIDALRSLAEAARRQRWVRPEITEESVLRLRDARHPVVEAMQGTFVPNDLDLGGEARLIVLTGPNMAGKSTYLRQAGLIVLLAQMGSFVPAREATCGLVDRLFSRIGAADDLAGGRSTFMVEMSEVADILSAATERSLLLLDEIGRGTSTFDGISIAWAVAEDIHDRIGARALVATHYLELADLEGLLEGAQNWSVSVAEKGEDVVFLRRVVRGPADRSYGLHVARLAGLPEGVLRRARRILRSLEKGSITRREAAATGQLAFSFHEPDVSPHGEALRLLEDADPEAMTPKDALDLIYRLKETMEDA